MKADLFDFDKTICEGDSGFAFWRYCLLRRPWAILVLPFQAVGGICYLTGHFPLLWKNLGIYSFLRLINAEKLIDGFWEKYEKKIYPYFLHRESSLPFVVCSASPDFLLRPLCEKLGAHTLIATKVNVKNGRIIGEACKGSEKVNRLKTELPDVEFEEVYSDSLKNDIHILRLGKAAFKVSDGKPERIDVLK